MQSTRSARPRGHRVAAFAMALFAATVSPMPSIGTTPNRRATMPTTPSSSASFLAASSMFVTPLNMPTAGACCIAT